MSRREDWMDPDARYAWDHDDPLEADDDDPPVVEATEKVIDIMHALKQSLAALRTE